MNEHQATQVRNFLEILFGKKLLNCWIEPSDAMIEDGWTVFFNFDNKRDYYIQSIIQMQFPEFWEKLLTVTNETV